MDNIKILLGKRIQELRKGKKLSQEALAEKIGIEPNNLSRIENGKNYPTPENLAKIAKELNVSVDKLYLFEHHQNYSQLKEEIVKALDDEQFGRLLYKFYRLIKE
ncbi:helix-turn-helix transcriptional regulator [bacterium]|nr:helix-turn-helix transcriptional regulator [bacterium]